MYSSDIINTVGYPTNSHTFLYQSTVLHHLVRVKVTLTITLTFTLTLENTMNKGIFYLLATLFVSSLQNLFYLYSVLSKK